MKKQIFTNTILYTHNTLVPVTKQDITASNQFGQFFKNNYKYNIIWVPQNPNGDTREIRIMPQYKFGHSDDPSSSFVDALSNPVSHNVSAQPSFTTSTFNSMANKTTFTDNIVLKLHSTVTNNALSINSSLSNYSSFLANIPHNISYNMAFRLVISIHNVTTDITEHTIYSYITNVRFGRSPIQKPGTPPDLIWDRKPDLTRYPLISTEPDPVILFEGQQQGGGVSPSPTCSSVSLHGLKATFDGKEFTLGTPYTITEGNTRWQHEVDIAGAYNFYKDTFLPENIGCFIGEFSISVELNTLSLYLATDTSIDPPVQRWMAEVTTYCVPTNVDMDCELITLGYAQRHFYANIPCYEAKTGCTGPSGGLHIPIGSPINIVEAEGSPFLNGDLPDCGAPGFPGFLVYQNCSS